jgi:metallo-beta-lactamase family protein
MFELQFAGGAGTVTGSKYILSCGGKKVLIDCGLFQGLKNLRLKNWEDLPVPASEIDALILTHAHIDHSGYIPRLVKRGFTGKIYCTPATLELCKILLPDTAYLMEEEAEYLNRHRRSKHVPALPLFTQREVALALKQFVPVKFAEEQNVGPQFKFSFRYAGHILGAASALIDVAGKKIMFTGDVGRMSDEILYPPDDIPQVDYLVTESTYGNRLHEKSDVQSQLEEIINRGFKRGAVMIIPAFAVGRAQSLLFHLWQLKKQKRIPNFPMYLNSPMATNVTGLLDDYKNLHRLTEKDCAELCSTVTYVRDVEESIALNEKKGPMLIISASGMLTGGRVLHHMKAFAPDAKNMILLSGFQAAGTRGEALMNKAREVKIHGDYVPVNAEVIMLDNMSAHADYSEMIAWFKKSGIKPRRVFITHGEASAADEFRRRVNESLGWDCHVPEHNETVKL